MRKYRSLFGLGLAIFILLFFVGNYCPLENIVGIPCPGCNMFTALYYLFLKGDIASAQYYHPAFMPFLVYSIACFLLYIKYKQEMGNKRIFKVLSVLFLIVFLGVYAYRMLCVFPNAPMQLNENAIFVRIFHRL